MGLLSNSLNNVLVSSVLLWNWSSSDDGGSLNSPSPGEFVGGTGLVPQSADSQTSLVVTSLLPDVANLVPSSVLGDPAISSGGVGSPVRVVLDVLARSSRNNSLNLWLLDDDLSAGRHLSGDGSLSQSEGELLSGGGHMGNLIKHASVSLADSSEGGTAHDSEYKNCENFHVRIFF